MTDTRALPLDSAIDRVFGPVIQRQTWKNVAYLVLSFPLGVLYFAVLVTMASAGAGLAFIFAGLAIWLGMFMLVDVLTEMERRFANSLLGAAIAPRAPEPTPGSILRRLASKARQSESWKRLSYLLIRFEIGVVSVMLVSTLLPVSLVLLTLPLTYGLVPITVGFAPVETFDQAIYFCCFGAVFLLLSVHVLNSWAGVCRRFAHRMLA